MAGTGEGQLAYATAAAVELIIGNYWAKNKPINMKFQRLTPMLWTNDLKKTADFYSQVLGFTIDEYREEWNWSHLHRDDIAFMIVHRHIDELYDGTPKYTGSFYLYIDEVDALWDELKDKANILYGIQNFPHQMREFAILDNNGYILQFGRDLKKGEIVDECE
jgi:uncharacterized glyoxalase superfamily protein PhnB